MNTNSIKFSRINHRDVTEGIDQLFIDEIPLGRVLNIHLDYDGTNLVPTLSSELCFEEGEIYIWSLINNPNRKICLPILMCSECDLHCLEHLVFVDITIDNHYVYWKQFGVLKLHSNSFERSHVEWWDTKFNFKFDKMEYNAVIDHYRDCRERKRIVDKIIHWLLGIERGFNLKKRRNFIYLSIEKDTNFKITLLESKELINEYAKWKENKRKSQILDLGKINLPLSKEELFKIIELAVNRIIHQYGQQSVINYTTEIYLGTDKENIIQIRNPKIAEERSFMHRLVETVFNI